MSLIAALSRLTELGTDGSEFIDENGGGAGVRHPKADQENLGNDELPLADDSRTGDFIELSRSAGARLRRARKTNCHAYCNIACNIYTLRVQLVLDTAAMVAAIRSDAGASRRLLVAALERRFKLLVSVPLMVEYQAVLTRAEHLAASGLSVGDVSVLLDAVATVCTPVRLAFLWRPTLRDPDDDMVLEAAVNGQAHAIVTFNRRDFRPAMEKFGIEVLTPGAAVERLGGP